MDVLKKCLAAFVVGGLLGVLGQLFFVLLGLIPNLEPRFAVYGTLLLMGAFALVTFPLGVYQKITDFGGFGAMLPFSGFAAAIADAFEGPKRETGSAGKAVLSSIKLFLLVIGVGTVLVAIVAAIVFYLIWGGQPAAMAAQAPVSNMFLGFLLAFLICGILSVVFQLFMMLTKLAPPYVLIIGFTVGTILVPLGALDWLQAIGGAGAFITVMAAGGAMGSALLALFAGNVVPLIEILVIFVCLTVIGIVAGFIRSAQKVEQ